MSSVWGCRSEAHSSKRAAAATATSSHYARAAEVYDSAPFHKTSGRNHETLLGLVVDRLALRAEHRLVDIGAGNGAFTDSLVQRVGGERATIVEPSKEFMTGVDAYQSIVAVHVSLEAWSKEERAGGAPHGERYDRMLLKEVTLTLALGEIAPG